MYKKYILNNFTPLHPESPDLQTGDEGKNRIKLSEKNPSFRTGVTEFSFGIPTKFGPVILLLEVSEKPLKFGQRPLITQILERLHRFYRRRFNLCNLFFNRCNHKEKLFQSSLLSFCILNFIGCATTPYVGPVLPAGVPGIYHRVEKGQTLWRISKIYNAELDEIAKFNRIVDTASIEKGQLIFIPHIRKPQTLPAGYAYDDFIWPARGRVIATFGQNFNNMVNKGINIQPGGNLNVVAARSGRVIFYADNFGHFGKTLIIDHGDGLSSVYARNSQVFIKVGDSIQKGTVISKVGSAGRDKNTYLHFEIRKGHIPKNPFYYLPR